METLKISTGPDSYPLLVGAFVRFMTYKFATARVALSFMLSDHARTLAEEGIPGIDLNATHSATVEAWKKRMSTMSVSTTGVNNSVLTSRSTKL